MAYDAQITARVGEKPVLTAQLEAAAGYTYTITAGMITVVSFAGTVILAPTAVSSFETGALAAPRAFYVLDTTSIPTGRYAALFSLSVTNSGGLPASTIDYDILLTVASAVDSVSTYDPTTLVGQTRFHMGDRDMSKPRFTDAELVAALSMSSQLPMLAAAMAIESLASSVSMVARSISADGYSTNFASIASALSEQAKALRDNVVMTPIVNSPDQIFSTNSGNGTVQGTTSLW